MTVFTKFLVADHEYAAILSCHIRLSHNFNLEVTAVWTEIYIAVYIVHAIALVQTVQISHN